MQRSTAQQIDTTTFRIVTEIGGGYAYKLTSPKTTLGEYTRSGVVGTLRLKWGTSNLIGVGLETGWIPISRTVNNAIPSEFGALRMKASLNAIPLMGLFSIQRRGIQLHTGIGYYRVIASATLDNETIESAEWNLGFLLSLGYALPLFEKHRIGIEVKWNNITEQKLSIISVQARYLYRLFEW